MTEYAWPGPRARPPRDIVDVLLEFARTLRHAGVAASPERVHATVAALAHLDVLDATQVYWAGRLTLCGDPADLDRYDAAFAAYFGARTKPPTRPGAPPPPVRTRTPALETADADGDLDQTATTVTLQASRHEILRHRDIADLTAAERAQLQRLFELLAPRVGRRRTHRYSPHPQGSVDLRRTVRQMTRHGNEPVRLARRKRRERPRRLVLLVDVSGSMSPYADVLLRFAHAAVRCAPTTTEVFTIGTRLTRVTRELALRDPDHAIRAAGAAIPDWSGGTRLGELIKAFLDRWGQRGSARGAVAVICSDGWERGDPALLGEQLARLAKLAHTVVWVNPHKGKDGFTPATGGMVAVLPHVDQLVAGHSFTALQELVEVIGGA